VASRSAPAGRRPSAPPRACRTSATRSPTSSDLDESAVIYLLIHRDLPNDEQLAAFKQELLKRRGVPQKVLDLMASLPKDGHPMEWLISGLMFLGMTCKTGDYIEDSYQVMAKLPELVAALFRIRSGWGPLIPSNPKLDLIEDFVAMLGVPGADEKKLTRLLKSFYILHMDHGGGNLSTFVGKAVASANTDMYASLAGAMAALYGPLHGRANQDCLEFVEEVGTNDPAEIEAFTRNAVETGAKIYGFGHAVLRAEDPRAAIQYKLGEELCPEDPIFRRAVIMREVVVRVLKEFPKINNPYPNVDAVSGTLLNACGLKDANYYTILFGLSRCSGIAAQIVDERVRMRGGKGVPIYRPKYVAEDQPKRRLG
jgi:citrate synthase